MFLAHGLTRAGVDVAVYERYGDRTDGLYGYRVGIDPAGNRALRECLSPELFRTFVATCAYTPRHFDVLTEKMRVTATFPLRDDSDDVDSERSVSRATLRQILFIGMEDVCRQLTAAAAGEKDLLAAIGDYEAEMIPYGFARVADSLNNNGTRGDDPLYRPVVGRFVLSAARAYFGLTSRIPALRKKFLSDLYTYRGADF
jgi:hypothetical protein